MGNIIKNAVGKINVMFKKQIVGFLDEEKYVGKAVRYSTIPTEQIVDYASKAAHVPASSMQLAHEAYFDAVDYFVLQGHHVEVPGLGFLGFSVKAKSTTNEEDLKNFSTLLLKGTRINLRPSVELRQALGNVSIEVSYDGTPSAPSPISVKKVGTKIFEKAVVNMPAAKPFPLSGEKSTILYIGGNKINEAFENLATTITVHLAGGETAVLPDSCIKKETANMLYGAYMLKGNRAQEWPDDVIGIANIKVMNGEQELFSRDFPAPSDAPAIELLYVNGTAVARGASVVASIGDVLSIKMTGSNFVDDIRVSSGTFVKTSFGESVVEGNFTVAQNGNVTFGVGGASYTISISAAASAPTASSLSANGVNVPNGGSSTIIEGNSYNFVLAGANLDVIEASNISVPSGASINITGKTANAVNFTLSNAKAGALTISYDGNTIFAVTMVEAPESNITIDGWKKTESGTQQALATKLNLNGASDSFYLVGEGIENLTTECIASGKGNVSYEPSTGKVSLTSVPANVDFAITVYADATKETSIATINARYTQSTGEDE